MTKGHNKDMHEDENTSQTNKDKGQSTKLKHSKKDDSPNQGRHANPDQSGGTKGANSI
ncbi:MULTISPECIES: hypothetical protein [Adhaeribacter]|uniref:Uncharacterized protein n=2 Tax=Adhaeribacter TaxID=299566 RepID=A0A369QKT0_9BACT|nr:MULTISPECIES: hypothetical protein [Adhaeribacter]QMU29703.1 hypothetical protein HUW48_17455 [Adhaeribacter radiodurans]RDC64255.1 hypothetical protein AHMF7616_02868 [Adhaeribacter pallidiroseus]